MKGYITELRVVSERPIITNLSVISVAAELIVENAPAILGKENDKLSNSRTHLNLIPPIPRQLIAKSVQV